MNEKNNLKTKIMRRVYGIWFVKKVLPYVAAEAAVFIGFLYFIGREVYIANVLQYTTSVLTADMAHPMAFVSFAMDMFIRTELGVQISLLGALLMATFVFRNLITSTVQLALAKPNL
ncbi:hypothetical protein A2127_00345 [Candidatus Jorgensenbacteria bacterium GWC1_48_12]|uniref:Uncharacterized protein n=1 Tax=Candidatus Jorgensenbacteria bacterium GWC1_48_12 TaxID=1798469 RepID=A0A1F6BRP3_9BACT|nr:MAG: hypothetical protein A2127_00345 [Candidatus Jorgensenbacteria bacterium GWC1_48_12]